MAKAKQNKPFKLSGVTFFWASTSTPNAMSKKYQVDLTNLPERYIEALEGMGVEVRNKGDDRAFFVTGHSQYPITVVDKNSELVQAKVANGSVGDAVCVVYPDKMNPSKSHVGINKMKVTELIEFDDSGDELDMDDIEEL